MRPRRALVALVALALAAPTACAPPASNEDARPTGGEAAATALDESTATYLAALPLACLDRPHGAPGGTGYLYDRSVALRLDYESTRAFYGCYDWHSAVNSTWTLVEILERFPDSRIAPLIVEKLDQHLGTEQLAGEVAFFADNRRFERPYGWAWFLALDAALRRSNHAHAPQWVEATAPLARVFVEGFGPYLANLDYPERVGTHRNTAFALDLVLAYARQTGNTELEASVTMKSRALFLDDRACALRYEPSASDFVSPCMETAKLLSAVLTPEEFDGWIDAYLGPADGPELEALAAPIMLRDEEAELDTGQLGAKSHLIGLAFTRAEALARIAAALPADDSRGELYRNVAERQAERGMAAMFEADYLGSHWLATFALKYLLVRG